jgi:DNA topoisomerase I
MKLIVVESPAKGRTIESFLGKEYKVTSSFGHIRDLPKGKLGIEIEKNFEPQYVIPTKAKKTVSALKKEAAKATEVILATDEDREGEAIAFHIQEILSLKDPKRIVFHEITKPAIQEALQHPRALDIDRVNAQQARRVLDRLVGYKLSPFLWKKVARRLSAGRVQSATVRLIADREKEIQAFIPKEYWGIIARVRSQAQNEFEAQLIKENNKPIGKLDIATEKQAQEIIQNLTEATWTIAELEKKEVQRNPFAPFTTSTMQQEAARKLGFPARLTMGVAQQLYETGLITYHRTDSLNLAATAVGMAQEYITKNFGKEYSHTRQFKTKSKGAQEAHEAIRPTLLGETKKALTPQQQKLYDLIQKRFLASQMAPAVFDATTVDIQAKNYIFRATGQILKFDGFLKVYPTKFEETELPKLTQGDTLELTELTKSQHFTQPPARYTEASLVKILEEKGIGRPSTYAPILSTIQDRGYVQKNEQKRFAPTELGNIVNDLLVQHFPVIVDIDFTASMEEQLDSIAEGKTEWVPMMKEFYEPFSANLEKKYEEVQKKDIVQEETGKTCPKCNSPLIVRFGRFGKFYACSKFPECKHTENIAAEQKSTGVTCPKCQKGKITAKRTKRGKIFYACNRYPDCDFALWQKPTGDKCKECSSLITEAGKDKTKCSNKDCPSLKT